jgi:hypothetical protein
MPDRYTSEAARAAGPDIDEDVPQHALVYIAALERLARDLYHAARGGPVRVPDPLNASGFAILPTGSRLSPELEARTCALLDMDPPGFDPSTEGP